MSTFEKSIRSGRTKRKQKTEILIHFQHCDWPQISHQKTHLTIKKVDMEKGKTLKTEDKLEHGNSSHLIKRAEASYLYEIRGFLPHVHYYQIMSHNPVKLVSLMEYLESQKGWKVNQYEVSVSNMVCGIENVLAWFEIDNLNNEDNRETEDNGLLILDYELSEFDQEGTRGGIIEKMNSKPNSARTKESDVNQGKSKLKNQTSSKLRIARGCEKVENRNEIGSRLGLTPQESSLLENHLMFRLVKVSDSRNDKNINNSEGLFDNPNIVNEGMLSPETRLEIANGKYLLVIWANPSFTFTEHLMQIKLAEKGNLNIKRVEDIKTFDFCEKYHPNKYFWLFQDRIMFNDDSVTMGLQVQLMERDKHYEPNSSQNVDNTNETTNKKKKGGNNEDTSKSELHWLLT